MKIMRDVTTLDDNTEEAQTNYCHISFRIMKNFDLCCVMIFYKIILIISLNHDVEKIFLIVRSCLEIIKQTSNRTHAVLFRNTHTAYLAFRAARQWRVRWGAAHYSHSTETTTGTAMSFFLYLYLFYFYVFLRIFCSRL